MPTTVTLMSEKQSAPAVIQTSEVSLERDGHTILDSVSLTISQGERWVILGANGCGKTSLLRILSLYLHPSRGDIFINGRALGTFDIRQIRHRLAYMSASLATDLRPDLTARDVVMTARYGALETWWNDYTDADRSRAHRCLEQMGVDQFAHRAIGSLSSGEQQRILLARVLMCDPIAILLDEPSARLDLGGREQLVHLLGTFAFDNPELPSVLVTHHVDEIPTSTTHCALLREGRLLTSGPLLDTLTSDALSECFAVPLVVEQRANGRLSAYAP